MFNFLGEYSNGWGHLIISITLLAVACFMFLSGNPLIVGSALGVVSWVGNYWLLTAAANTAARSATMVQAAANQAAPPPAAPPETKGDV